MTREYFNERLKSELRYYYWSKCEHEIIVAPWIGSDDAAIKVDIYDQVMNNWERFTDYVWQAFDWTEENDDVAYRDFYNYVSGVTDLANELIRKLDKKVDEARN